MGVEVDELRQVRFLEPLKERALKRLAAGMTERTAPEGEELVKQGESGVAFFVVLDGELSVIVGGKEVRRLGPGDHFGEIALIVPDASRSATVRAVTRVRVGCLSTWNFKGFLSEHPETHWPLLVTLAGQVSAANS
jgi:CRP/FNR family transcriptional regulator, cyclic AMP receptor protein